MGFLRNLILGDPETQGMQVRVRIFDHGHHIKTVTVKNRGQDYVTVVVKGKDYGFLGEEIKLAFMINPEIPPKYFGNIMEIDYDVRDSTPLGDLFDLCPDLVHDLNRSLHKTLDALKQEKSNVIEAEFTEKTQEKGEETENDESLIALTDLLPDPVKEPEKEKTDLEKRVEKIPGVVPVTQFLDVVTNIPHNVTTNMRGVNILLKIGAAPDEEKQELVIKALDFCSLPGNQKCLRWLPRHLHIEPEVSHILSQIELDGVGVMPMYYVKQTTAQISEKMLERPKPPEDWKTTAIYIIGILAVLGIVVYFLLKASGRM